MEEPVKTAARTFATESEFLSSLKQFFFDRGCPSPFPLTSHRLTLGKVPQLGGQEVDLFTLYTEVTKHGGLEKVIENRVWKEIIPVFQFPSTCTNAAYNLRVI